MQYNCSKIYASFYKLCLATLRELHTSYLQHSVYKLKTSHNLDINFQTNEQYKYYNCIPPY